MLVCDVILLLSILSCLFLVFMALAVAELPRLVSKSHEKHFMQFLQTQLHVICCYFE